MMPENYRKAFIEGFRARRENAFAEDENPHPTKSNEWHGWDDGWRTAFAEDEPRPSADITDTISIAHL